MPWPIFPLRSYETRQSCTGALIVETVVTGCSQPNDDDAGACYCEANCVDGDVAPYYHQLLYHQPSSINVSLGLQKENPGNELARWTFICIKNQPAYGHRSR